MRAKSDSEDLVQLGQKSVSSSSSSLSAERSSQSSGNSILPAESALHPIMRTKSEESASEHRFLELHEKEGMLERRDNESRWKKEDGNLVRPMRHICIAWGINCTLDLSLSSSPSRIDF